MYNRSNRLGFTLIEIMVVIALIAITLTVVMPNLSRRNKNSITAFTHNFNLLMQKGYLNALETSRTQRIFLDFKNRRIELQEASSSDNKSGEIDFAAVKSPRYKTSFEWPSSLE